MPKKPAKSEWVIKVSNTESLICVWAGCLEVAPKYSYCSDATKEQLSEALEFVKFRIFVGLEQFPATVSTYST